MQQQQQQVQQQQQARLGPSNLRPPASALTAASLHVSADLAGLALRPCPWGSCARASDAPMTCLFLSGCGTRFSLGLCGVRVDYEKGVVPCNRASIA